MQEKFAFRKILKKVAAVGTSLALVGVTVSGALAAGLGDLPSPFNKNAAQTAVVYGDIGSDMDAVNDVIVGIGGSVGTSAVSSLGVLTLAQLDSGRRKDVAVGDTLAADFGTMDETDGIGLVDGQVSIDITTDKDYDYHEELVVGSGVLSTALDLNEEDFGDKVVLTFGQDDMAYNLVFDDVLDAGNFINDSTATDAVTLPFLGQNLVVTGADANSITAFAGDKYALKNGDSVSGVCSGKTVTLLGVSDDAALLDVSGVQDSIDTNNRARVNGCEIYVDDAFNSDNDANDRALLVVQGNSGQAVQTYTDGDEYLDEDQNNYLWAWNLVDLDTAAPTVGVTLFEDLSTSDTDELDDAVMNLGLLKDNQQYISEGGYLCLPHRYECVFLEGVNGDKTWKDYNFEAGKQQALYYDTDNTDADYTSATDRKLIQVDAKGFTDKGFLVGADDTKAETIWFFYNDGLNGTVGDFTGNEGVQVFARDTRNSKAVLMAVGGSGDNEGVTINDGGGGALVTFDNGDYNAGLWVTVDSEEGADEDDSDLTDDGGDVTFTIGSVAGAGNLTFTANATGDGFVGLGDSVDEDTTPYLRYDGRSIASWETNVRNADGVVVKDPKGNLENDKVQLSVPDDDEFNYWVRVAKPKAGSVGGGTVSASLKLKDTEVADVTTLGKNVVSVGGPAVNKVTAALLGVDFPTYGGGVAGLSAGKAVLELKDNGAKKALLVFGWDADDTRRAALVVKNAATFKADLGSKTSVTVTGTDLTVSGIAVA